MIRPAVIHDLPHIIPLFEKACNFMRKSGNLNQWINGYPSESIILADIRNGDFYVETFGGRITGCFAFIIGEEPTYQTIQGSWADNNPYGTIHRLASDGSVKGVSDRCIEFCLKKIPALRADTHRDNLPMQRALERNGFQYRGIIHVADGSERLAYQLSPLATYPSR